MEQNFYTEDSVVQFGKDWDFKHAELIKLSDIQKRICRYVLTPDENGKFPYRTIFYSTIKKEGKTTLAGTVGAWWAACMNPPNLILTLANDQEQSAGRIFGAMKPTLAALGCKVPTAVSSKPEVRLPNGTVVRAIANNYAGNAGANYGLTLWSELWAYTTERSRKLYDELVPVLTKPNSIRWVETYVGFEDESELMLHQFKRIFTDTSETTLQPGVEVVPELADITSDGKPCCYHIPSEGLFYYHNHTPQMPWSTTPEAEIYRNQQKAELRPAQYTRLWRNYWQTAEGTFIRPEEYDEACVLEGEDLSEPFVLAGDGSMRNDTTFLIGVRKYFVEIFGVFHERYKLCYVGYWDPKIVGLKTKTLLGGKKGDIDLEETIARDVVKLKRRNLIKGAFWYDNFQMHQVAIALRKKQIACVEFGQNNERELADTFLGDVLRKGQLDMFYHPVLEQHVKGAKVKELENQKVRIIKGTIGRANKVDGCVALSMAVYKASQLVVEKPKRYSTSSRTLK